MSSYEFENVSVDNAFARFGSKSFAINKITSVDVRSTHRSGAWGFYGWWALTAAFTIGAIVNLVHGLDPTLNVVLAVVFALIGFASFANRKPITSYQLYLHTAGSEAQAYVTRDEREIATLRSAIETAMAASG